jgi:hypothetical protein
VHRRSGCPQRGSFRTGRDDGIRIKIPQAPIRDRSECFGDMILCVDEREVGQCGARGVAVSERTELGVLKSRKHSL